jgi:hypothetical protein
MKQILKPCKLVIMLSPLLLLLCSCATIHAPLPTDVPLNKDAARGNLVTVALRLKSSEELLFAVDTCAPATVLDISLGPKLGHRIDTVSVFKDGRDSKHRSGVSLTPLVYLREAKLKFTNYIMWGTKESASIYRAPRLYLGDTPLKIDGNAIISSDLKSVIPPGLGLPRIMGILGMDVLKNYCIQLDFEAKKMRFLDPHHLNAAGLGRAFPILYKSEDTENQSFHPSIQLPSLLGGPVTDLFIDTGLGIDGTVNPELFRWEVAQQRRWDGNAVFGNNGGVWFAKCVWNGETYTNLLIGPGGGAFENGQYPNFIGLPFLARHLVTFDFPHGIMYLKQTSAGPLMDESIETADALLIHLKTEGKLPGWSANEIGTIYFDIRGSQIEFDGRKNGDSSDYHYKFSRMPHDSSWILQRAWRTNKDGKTIEELPIP